jgi:AraC-like DNA-binding protein
MAAFPAFPKVYLYRRIVSAKLFIDERFAENIDLDNIADEAYFSKFHFIRLFKSIYYQTPHQYLSSTRIEQAKALLQTGMPAAHVCYAVGFESVSTFTGLFKRITGQTPSAYRQARKERMAAITTQPLRFIPNCFAEKNGWRRVG